KGERIIFVGGANRSGTTLMQNILDSHPEICGGPEFRHVPDIIEVRNKLHESIGLKRMEVFCSCDEVDAYIKTLIGSLLLPLLEKSQCKYLSEKTPANILVFTELKSLFPASRFIRVVREPRAVMASEVEMRKKRKANNLPCVYDGSLAAFRKVLHKVKKYYISGAASTQLSPERELLVKYEDLVSDVEGVSKRICHFLEIPWFKEMLSPSTVEHLGEGPMTRTGAHYTKDSFRRDPDTRSLGKWKHQLTMLQKAVIAAEFSDCHELSQLGYDLREDGIVQKVLTSFISNTRNLAKRTVTRKVGGKLVLKSMYSK
ncbi:MAG: sulfotransferase family protein, partial [Nitrospirales bacterium]